MTTSILVSLLSYVLSPCTEPCVSVLMVEGALWSSAGCFSQDLQASQQGMQG